MKKTWLLEKFQKKCSRVLVGTRPWRVRLRTFHGNVPTENGHTILETALGIGLAFAVLLAGSAYGVTYGVPGEPTGLAQLDGSAPNENYAAAEELAVVGNVNEDNPDAFLLLQIPSDWLDELGDNPLRAELCLKSHFSRWLGTNTLRLRPLAAAYAPESVTWNESASGMAWSTPGGTFDATVPPIDAAASTEVCGETTKSVFRFDLRPWLTNAAARTAMATYGVRVEVPEEAAPDSDRGFIKVFFHNPAVQTTDAAALLGARGGIAFDSDQFAVGYIDSKPKNGTAETVLWEQGIGTVGKCLLNGQDGSECRAIFTMPKELRTLAPAAVAGVSVSFDIWTGDYQGERITMYPLIAGPKLEERDWATYIADYEAGRKPDEPAMPTHGPSWAWADGPVNTDDTEYERIPWAAPMTQNVDGNSSGPWDSSLGVDGVVTTRKATFDLTALWRDPAARKLLLENGAIVVMDPANWEAATDSKRMPRVNLYRPDIFVQAQGHVSLFTVEPGKMAASGPDAVGVSMFAQLDAAEPDTKFTGNAKVIMNAGDGGDANVAGHLAGLDPGMAESLGQLVLTYSSSRTVVVDGVTNMGTLWMAPLTRPIGQDEATWPTWNNAINGSAPESWTTPGGDADTESAVAGVWDDDAQTLTYDLSSWSPTSSALKNLADNGFLLWFAEADRPEVGFYRFTFPSSCEGSALHLTNKALGSVTIDSGAPDTPLWGNGTAKVLLNGNNETECRTLYKFSNALLSLEASNQRVTLVLTTFRNTTDGRDVVLHPLSAPFRLDQVTWDHSGYAPWTTPGGDFMDAGVSAELGDGYANFDLTALLRDPATADALLKNGAVVRMLGDFPESGNAMLNGHTSANEDSALRPILVETPADLAICDFSMTASSTDTPQTLSLRVEGLDATHDYGVWAAADLAGEWTRLGSLAADGAFAADLAEDAAMGFFRIVEE